MFQNLFTSDEGERVCVFVCLRERKRERIACVCERNRERERERRRATTGREQESYR